MTKRQSQVYGVLTFALAVFLFFLFWLCVLLGGVGTDSTLTRLLQMSLASPAIVC